MKKSVVLTVSFTLCAVLALSAGLFIKSRAASAAQKQLKADSLRRDALLAEAVDELEKNVTAAAVLSASDIRSKYCCRAYSACRTAENCLSTTSAGESVYILLDIIKEECLSFGNVGEYMPEIGQLKERLRKCKGNYEQLSVDIAAPVTVSHINSTQPAVSEDEAKRTAAQFMKVDKDKLIPRQQTKGKIPCYCFVMDGASVYVSKAGGRVRLYTCDTVYAKSELEVQTCVDKAKDFTQGLCGKTELIKMSENGGLVTCVFAGVHDTVPCLNETVRITVSRENGKVTFYDATQLLLNCKDRTVPDGIISAEQAANSLAEDTRIKSSKLVFVEDGDKKEKLCYELTVSRQSKQSLVYVDAVSGKAVSVY